MADDLSFDSVQQLTRARNEVLNATLDRIFDFHPYYKALFAGQGVKRADIRGIEDLVRLPLTSKADYVGDPVGFKLSLPDAFDAEGKLKWIGDDVVINFGKSRGKALRALAGSEDGRGMLGWMLRQDFGEDVKTAVRNALAGRFPTRG